LAQGAFSVARGGNFWQGAAAGAFSSLAGSAFGAWCPIDIRTSFVGVTAFSAVVGGAGAYLGGARSPAEILMGVAAGAMVGALNDGLHALVAKEKTLTLKFDGKNIYVIENGKKIIYTSLATSGRGENMNNPDAQSIENSGPIQAGKYKFSNNSWQSQSKLRQMYNIVRGNGDWGDMNVPLEIVNGKQTRNSFYLHGGFFEGSAGCIDAGSNISNIYNLIKNQKTTYLYVKY